MTLTFVKQWAPWFALGALIALAYLILLNAPTAEAQAAQRAPCRVAIVLDRSGSVGARNLNTMRQQIRRLFEPVSGMNSDNIYLAFWSFAAYFSNNPPVNYDAPYNGFVRSTDFSTFYSGGFRTALESMVSSGSTNYEQGFAYNRGNPNSFAPMPQIVGDTDIIVFMTDGLPNAPRSATNPNAGSDNNTFSRNAGRDAVLKHRAAGRIVIGGMIGNASRASLNYVLNGSTLNGTNVFTVSQNYGDLAARLKSEIGDECDKLNPPEPDSDYDLVPRVTTDDRVVSGSGSASFRYSTENLSQTDDSEESRWTIKRVVVSRGQSIQPLLYTNSNGKPYRDGYSCADLEALVNDRGTCTEIASGRRVFSPGDTDMTTNVGGAANLVLNDDWGVGTKLCFVLTIDRPTAFPNPVNRFSSAACTVVGKRPLVQIHGGDLKVGRYFAGDEIGTAETNVIGSTVTKSNGRTYGSWAEYAVFTPGIVSGFATMSGLNGGFASSQPNTQDLWSALTFANTDNEYGRFNDPGALGTIHDVTSALLASRSVVRNLDGDNIISFNGNVQNGIYRKESGSIRLNASSLGSGRSVVLYVPNGDVTIGGNVTYDDGPYTNLKQIPQLVIIARNITIAESVVRVDAWLVARGEAGQGIINTCGNNNTLTSEICDAQLRINGPVMAQRLDLRRTAGAGTGGASDDPAEIINLPANTYLWSHTEGSNFSRIQTTSTIELPPYF